MGMDRVTCIDVHGNTYETPRSALHWRPAAYAIVIHKNHVLLLRQFGDKYALPGGGLDLGEDPKEAVIREVKEEAGIEVINPVSLSVDSCLFRSAHSDDRSYHSLLIYYACTYVSGEISITGWDEYERRYVDAVEWVPLDKVPELKVGSTVDFRPYIIQVSSETIRVDNTATAAAETT